MEYKTHPSKKYPDAMFILDSKKHGKSSAWFAKNEDEWLSIKSTLPEDVKILDYSRAIHYLNYGQKGCGKLYQVLVREGFVEPMIFDDEEE